MSLIWTEQLSVGNEMLDLEHKIMIDIINDIGGAFKSGSGASLAHALERLENYSSMHFVNEEKVARAANFPFAQHKDEHQYLQQELRYIKEQLIGMDGAWSDGAARHFTTFLGRWVVDHISNKDILMKPVLDVLPPDFKPA